MNRSLLILIAAALVVLGGIGFFVFAGNDTPEKVTADGGQVDSRRGGGGSSGNSGGDGGPEDEKEKDPGKLVVKVPAGYESKVIVSGDSEQVIVTRPGSATPAGAVIRTPSLIDNTSEYVSMLAAPTPDGSAPKRTPIRVAGAKGSLLEFAVPELGKVRFIAVAVIEGRAVTVTTEGPVRTRASVQRLAQQLAAAARIER